MMRFFFDFGYIFFQLFKRPVGPTLISEVNLFYSSCFLQVFSNQNSVLHHTFIRDKGNFTIFYRFINKFNFNFFHKIILLPDKFGYLLIKKSTSYYTLFRSNYEKTMILIYNEYKLTFENISL